MAAIGAIQRNILIVSIDTLRYDCIGAHPDKSRLDAARLLYTPTLDELARRGAFLTNAFSTSTYTTAAHASLFTGLEPPHHGVRGFFVHRLHPTKTTTLAETFAAQGYATLFFSDTPLTFKATDLTRGFQVYCRSEGELLDRVAEATGPVFAFVHFFDCHAPYLFSHGRDADNGEYLAWLEGQCKETGVVFSEVDHFAAFNGVYRKLGGAEEVFFPAYVRGVSRFDRGRLAAFCERLEGMGALDRAWTTVFLSDHGEGRTGEVGRGFGHEGWPYDEVLRVPVIIAGAAGWDHADKLCSIVDVGRWLAEGVLHPPDRGMIYAEVWKRERGSGGGSFDAGAREWVHVARSERYKLCRLTAGSWVPILEVYDMSIDPLEEWGCIGNVEAVITESGVFGALWGYAQAMRRDPVDLTPIRLYSEMATRIRLLLQRVGDGPIAICGAGEHTKMLVRETDIEKANVAAVVDEDPAKWRTECLGREVMPPEALRVIPIEAVVLSSHDFQEDMAQTVRAQGVPDGKLVRLYGSGLEDDYTDRERAEVERRLTELGY
jgi:hypothetical protein